MRMMSRTNIYVKPFILSHTHEMPALRNPISFDSLGHHLSCCSRQGLERGSIPLLSPSSLRTPRSPSSQPMKPTPLTLRHPAADDEYRNDPSGDGDEDLNRRETIDEMSPVHCVLLPTLPVASTKDEMQDQ